MCFKSTRSLYGTALWKQLFYNRYSCDKINNCCCCCCQKLHRKLSEDKEEEGGRPRSIYKHYCPDCQGFVAAAMFLMDPSSCRWLLCSSVGGSEVIGKNKGNLKKWKKQSDSFASDAAVSASVCYRMDWKILFWTFRPLYRSATRYFAEHLCAPPLRPEAWRWLISRLSLFCAEPIGW